MCKIVHVQLYIDRILAHCSERLCVFILVITIQQNTVAIYYPLVRKTPNFTMSKASWIVSSSQLLIQVYCKGDCYNGVRPQARED